MKRVDREQLYGNILRDSSHTREWEYRARSVYERSAGQICIPKKLAILRAKRNRSIPLASYRADLFFRGGPFRVGLRARYFDRAWYIHFTRWNLLQE